MPAATSDYLKKTGSNTVTTLSAPGKSMGATSITVGSTTNFPTDTGIIIAIRQVDSAGELVAGTYTEWSATVTSGTTLGIVATPVYGSDQVYTAGSTTQVYIPLSSYSHNKLIDGILVHADQDGTLKAGAVDVTAVLADSVVTSAKIANDTITNDDMATDVKPYTNISETTFDYVASGCVWSGDAYGSTRVASMTAGVVYIGGKRIAVSAVTSRTFTASRDVYVDVDNTGTLTYTDATTNAASSTLAANSIRLAIIVVGASNIASAASVNQGQETMIVPIASSIAYSVTDSLGNLICPRDPNRRILGIRQRTSNFTTATNSLQDITGLNCPVIVPTGRKVRITIKGSQMSTSSATSVGVYLACNDVTATAEIARAQLSSQASVSSNNLATLTQPYTPPASGARTFKAQGYADSGTYTLAAASTSPAYIMVELV